MSNVFNQTFVMRLRFTCVSTYPGQETRQRAISVRLVIVGRDGMDILISLAVLFDTAKQHVLCSLSYRCVIKQTMSGLVVG